jgi:prevent-host-death family protein
MRVVQASQFKTHCLAILDEIERTGEAVVITKRGRVIARVTPATNAQAGYPQDRLRGTVTVLGDIVAPAADADEWESMAATDDLP